MTEILSGPGCGQCIQALESPGMAGCRDAVYESFAVVLAENGEDAASRRIIIPLSFCPLKQEADAVGISRKPQLPMQTESFWNPSTSRDI